MFLPTAKVFLNKEAKRAKDLGLVGSENEVIKFFNDLMKNGTSSVLQIALKYFFYPGQRPGWVLLQVIDPYVGPLAAAAILLALKRLDLIDIDLAVLEEIDVIPIAVTIPTVDQVGSEYDQEGSEDEQYNSDSEERASNTIDERGLEFNAVRSEREIEAVTAWTVESKTHAAPGITMAEYRRLIISGLEEASRDTVKGIVEAYGLSHKTVITELTT